MQLFHCSHCSSLVYFDNFVCVNCQSRLGFNVEQIQMVAFPKSFDPGNVDKAYKFCVNANYHVCNWLLPANSAHEFCEACKFNSIIPDLSNPIHKERWAKLEDAKHRLIYSLRKLKLPLVSKSEDAEKGLLFEFKADSNRPNADRILTGHANGVITLNIAEADDVEREMAKQQMDEMYRTLVGHFRHEIGHYYWDLLISRHPEKLRKFRKVFGDERLDYGKALEEHYQKPHNNEWQKEFISRYASVHPWEDWAETWAHYLHIVDGLETAFTFGVNISSELEIVNTEGEITRNPYQVNDFKWIYDRWLPITILMNSMNKSMGLSQLYPFVINSKVYKKLETVHQFIRECDNTHSS